MHKQILRGARLGNCVLQNDDVRVEIVCDFTETVREEMDWSEPSSTQKLAAFDDEFGGGSFKLTSDQKVLEGGTTEIAVPFDSISGFRCVRCKEKGQDSTRLELRFHICTTAPEAIQYCQAYKQTVKKGVGPMRVTIGAKPKTEPVPPLMADSKPSEDLGERISMIDGMATGKRGRGRPRKVQIEEAAAGEVGEAVTPFDGEAVAEAIDQSLQ